MKIAESRFKIISSLEKVFFDYPEAVREHKGASIMKNEIHSFQLVGHIKTIPNEWNAKFRVELESDLKDCITMYKVGYVPVNMTALPHDMADDDFITKKPGLFPDILNKVRDNTFEVYHDTMLTLWITVEPESRFSGKHDITVKVYEDDENTIISELSYSLDILDIELPEQKLINTGWFHGDSIAVKHNVEIGSEEYYGIVEKYMDVYAKFGHNMILTPIFTPPLDTDVGAERMTNQLVGVTVTDGKYTFDFSELGRWIDLSRKHNIKYFEISHLFTQWGAEFTPKIMATVDGEYKRIFGWDVEALSDEYKAFLDAFMPQLIGYLKEKGVYESSFFHVSDEPQEKHAVQYEKTSNILRSYVGSERMMEAISDYVFYEKGLINRPVPSNDHIDAFLDNNVKNLWTYYCCCQGDKVANRFMAMPSYRNRVLGYQLYKYNIEGFLQWGYNFWFSVRARYEIDPHYVTDAVNSFPSGDAFIVYPLDSEGEVEKSLRLYVFNEGLQDMRALELLESLTDREAVLAMLDDIVRFKEYPRNAEFILNLREAVNEKIREAM